MSSQQNSSLQSEQYGDRASRVFQRINNIQSNIENEKVTRFQSIMQIITSFESQLDELNKRKHDKFEQIAQRLKTLSDVIEEEQDISTKLDADQQKEIINMERNCKRLIEANQKERVEAEKQIAQGIASQVDAINIEVQREGQAQSVSHQYLDTYLQEDLPRLKDELAYEVSTRKEVEEKIYNQFIEQIGELKENFERERKEREQKEEQLIATLREISTRVQEQLLKIKRERETNEEMMVMLVEQIIEKMKKEIVELDI